MFSVVVVDDVILVVVVLAVPCILVHMHILSSPRNFNEKFIHKNYYENPMMAALLFFISFTFS